MSIYIRYLSHTTTFSSTQTTETKIWESKTRKHTTYCRLQCTWYGYFFFHIYRTRFQIPMDILLFNQYLGIRTLFCANINHTRLLKSWRKWVIFLWKYSLEISAIWMTLCNYRLPLLVAFFLFGDSLETNCYSRTGDIDFLEYQ